MHCTYLVRYLGAFLVIILPSILFAQTDNVGIGTDSPDPSARLEIQSDDQGILIPRMTSALRMMIDAPATGLLIYQTDDQAGFWFYNGTDWISLSGGTGSGGHEIVDGDSDTRVQVDEGGVNDNTVRIDVEGEEVVSIDSLVRIKAGIDQLVIGTEMPDGQSTIQSHSELTGGRGVSGSASGASSIGVYGTADNPSTVSNYGGQFNANGTQGTGVSGLALGAMGRGVYGIAANATASTNFGGYFWANGFSGKGVFAETTGPEGIAVHGTATSGASFANYGGYFEATGLASSGVYGESSGVEGRGVYGYASNPAGTVSYGGYFVSESGSGAGAYGSASDDSADGLRGFASGEQGNGVKGTATGNLGAGVEGNFNDPTNTFGNGGSFISNAIHGRGVQATVFGEQGRAVYGVANNPSTTNFHYGGYFQANGPAGIGVHGEATNTTSVNVGGSFVASGALGIGVRGTSHAAGGIGVLGRSDNGWAGRFEGKVNITGSLEVGSGNNVFQSEGSNLLSFRGTFTPYFDASYDLGSSAKRWKDIYASNGVIQTSDARLKSNIHEIAYGLDAVLALRPVSYCWIDGEQGEKLGLIAQEVGAVVPEVVHGYGGGDPEAVLGIKYAELVPVLIQAIQELEAEVRALRERD